MIEAVVGLTVVVFLGAVAREVYRARARIRHAESILRNAREALERLEAQVARDAFALEGELRRRAGGALFGPETPVQDALRFHPKAGKLFTKHRRSGIIRIDWEGHETIADACRLYDIDQEGLLKELNALR